MYLFATTRDLTAGYREGDRKYVLNLRRDRASAYDLATDPEETHPVPLAGHATDVVKRRLAAWVQYQEALYPAK